MADCSYFALRWPSNQINISATIHTKFPLFKLFKRTEKKNASLKSNDPGATVHQCQRSQGQIIELHFSRNLYFAVITPWAVTGTISAIYLATWFLHHGDHWELWSCGAYSNMWGKSVVKGSTDH